MQYARKKLFELEPIITNYQKDIFHNKNYFSFLLTISHFCPSKAVPETQPDKNTSFVICGISILKFSHHKNALQNHLII